MYLIVNCYFIIYQSEKIFNGCVLKLEKLEQEEKQQAYFNLGNTYFNLKDKKKACENWSKALENGAEYAKERIAEHCK